LQRSRFAAHVPRAAVDAIQHIRPSSQSLLIWQVSPSPWWQAVQVKLSSKAQPVVSHDIGTQAMRMRFKHSSD